MEKYGAEYKQARQEKLQSMAVPHDEVTYRTDNLEAHHAQPKMFDGVDTKENLVFLCRDFHSYIHQVCNVKSGELVQQRSFYAKKIWRDPLSNGVPKAKEQLAEIDNVLMREWIQNMIHNIGDRYRDKVLEVTMFANMQTIRELKIKIHQLEQKLQAYEASQDKSFKK